MHSNKAFDGLQWGLKMAVIVGRTSSTVNTLQLEPPRAPAAGTLNANY